MSAIELADKRTYYFCGTGCLLKTWLQPEKYLGTTRDRILRVRVTDYFTGAHLDGRKMVWIAGSDVVGPMGPALVPVQTDEDAAAFEARHGGKHRFDMNSLDADKWRLVTGKPLVVKEK